MNRCIAFATAAALSLAASSLAAQTTVKWMHIETNNVNIANYFKQTAEAFEAKNPGVKVEIQVPGERGLQGQADHAAAVERQAAHHLQLGRRRAARRRSRPACCRTSPTR